MKLTNIRFHIKKFSSFTIFNPAFNSTNGPWSLGGAEEFNQTIQSRKVTLYGARKYCVKRKTSSATSTFSLLMTLMKVTDFNGREVFLVTSEQWTYFPQVRSLKLKNNFSNNVFSTTDNIKSWNFSSICF